MNTAATFYMFAPERFFISPLNQLFRESDKDNSRVILMVIHARDRDTGSENTKAINPFSLSQNARLDKNLQKPNRLKMESLNFTINHRSLDLHIWKIPQKQEHENLLHIFYKASVRNVFLILLFDLWIFLQPSIQPNSSATDDCDYDILNCKNRFLRVALYCATEVYKRKMMKMDFSIVGGFFLSSIKRVVSWD